MHFAAMDKRLNSVAFILFVVCSVCTALRCHVCSHSKSWDYCEKYRTIHTCSPAPNRTPMCYRLEKYRNFMNNTRDNYFSKGCIYSHHCKISYMCTKGDNCKLNCCNTDLCNGAPSSGKTGTESRLVLTLSGILSLILMNFLYS